MTAQIAVIIESSMVVRQAYADIQESLARLGNNDELPFLARIVTESSADSFLSNVDPADCDVILIASNALLIDEGSVVQAFEKRGEDVTRYIQSGGSLILLHQANQKGFRAALPRDVDLDITDRLEPWQACEVEAVSNRDPLLNFPNRIKLDDFIENESCVWRGGQPLHYQSVLLPHGGQITPVLRTPSGIVLARTEIGDGKFVACTLPVDWAREEKLFVNILFYATCGVPTAIVWESPETTESDLSHARYEMVASRVRSGGPVVTKEIPDDWVAASKRGDLVDMEPLLKHVKLNLFPSVPTLTAAFSAWPELRAHVCDGGTLLATEPLPADGEGATSPAMRVLGVVGSGYRIAAARIMLAALAQSFLPKTSDQPAEDVEQSLTESWVERTSIYDLRSVCRALAAINGAGLELEGMDSIDPASLVEVKRRIQGILRGSWSHTDIISTVVLGMFLCRIWGMADEVRGELEWLRDHSGLEGEAAHQVQFLFAYFESDEMKMVDVLCALVEDTPSTSSSFGAVARACDLLHEATQSGSWSRRSEMNKRVKRFAELVIVRLETVEPDERTGWLSVETTARICLGLLAAMRLGADERSAISLLGKGSRCMERVIDRYDADRRSIGTLACSVEAIVELETVLPAAAERFAIAGSSAVSSRLGIAAPEANSGISQLMTRMQQANESLRTENRELFDRLERTRSVASEERVQQEKAAALNVATLEPAARLGRVIYRLGLIALVLIVLGTVVFSIYEIIANRDYALAFTALPTLAVIGPVLVAGTRWGREKGLLTPLAKSR